MSVASIISNANARSEAAIEQAQTFIDQLASLASDGSISLGTSWGLEPWDEGLAGDVRIPQPDNVSSAGPSGLQSLTLDSVEVPDAPAAVDYFEHALPNVWTDGVIPDFTDEAPTVEFPNAPTTAVPVAPSEHEVRDVVLNEWTEYDLPSTPTITENPLPAPDALNVIATDLTVPELNLTAPANTFSYVENDYSSTLLTSLEDLLVGDLQNGGYGINPDDEQGIYDRARDREMKQAVVTVEQIRRGVAARGFPVPPGSLFAAERATFQEADAALSGLNREIVLKRSDLYVQARQFAVQQGVSVEQALMNYVGAKQERSLRAAQTSAELAIQFHNANVQLFQLQVEVRRLYRELHGEHLATVLAKTEEYKQEVLRSDAEARQNESRLSLHRQMLEAVKTAYEAQRLRDQHTESELEIERLKLQASQDRTNIYATKVRARSDEFDAYRAALSAEEAKLSVFEQQVRAHSQRTDVVVKTSQMRQDRFNAEIRRIEVDRARYATLLQRYSEKLRGAVAEVEARAQANGENIDIWKNAMQADQFNVTKDLERDIEQAAKILGATQANNGTLQASTNAVLQLKELNAAAAKTAVALYENQIAGAESSLSAIATLAEGSS